MTIMLKQHIQDTNWKHLEEDKIPFLNYDFIHALETSGSIGNNSGWNSLFFEEKDQAILYSFEKTHSYGEYIFDWDWASGFEKNNIPYYPKLTSMIPFTPATTNHFAGKRSVNLMNHYENYYKENHYSSSHFLFLSKKEIEFFKSYNYLIRDSFQYHFYNENYQNFEGFLSRIKNKKAKQIRKERLFSPDINFQSFTGNELNQNHAIEMFKFYQSTITAKQAISYLNLDFFLTVFDKLKTNICYIQATKNNSAIAGSLFFYDKSTLYGRYWGSTENISNLHFELCYYQGIDFCIKNKIKVFEAGAQGEHKIARGFKPVKTFSAHKIKHPSFHQAVAQYIQNERQQIDHLFLYLNERQPYTKSNS